MSLFLQIYFIRPSFHAFIKYSYFFFFNLVYEFPSWHQPIFCCVKGQLFGHKIGPKRREIFLTFKQDKCWEEDDAGEIKEDGVSLVEEKDEVRTDTILNEIEREYQYCVPEEEHDDEGIKSGELFESKNISSVSTANASMAPIGGAELLDEDFHTMDHEEHQEPNCHYQSKNNEPWLDIDI